MKKMRLFAVAALLLAFCGLTTSCIKEGDFDALKHPIYLQGDFNPDLGVPLGGATLTVNDLLNMFKQAQSYVQIDPANDLVTVCYDSSYSTTINFNSKRKALEDSMAVFTNVLSGELPIDLFNNVRELEKVNIQNIIVDLSAFVKVHGSPQTEQFINEQGLQITFDSIRLDALGKRGNFSIQTEDGAIACHDFLNGDTVVLFNDDDISQLINCMPTKLTYAVRMNVAVPGRVFESDLSMFQFIADSLEINTMDVDVMFGTHFPLSVSLEDLESDIDLALGLSNQTLDELTIDTSSIVLEMENGLPISFKLGASFVDSLTNVHYDLFDGGLVTIEGGQIAPDAANGTNVVTAPTTSTIRIPLTNSKMQAFLKSKKLSIQTSISTSASGSTHPVCSVRGSDALKVRVYVQVRPNVHINIPIINTSNK